MSVKSNFIHSEFAFRQIEFHSKLASSAEELSEYGVVLFHSFEEIQNVIRIYFNAFYPLECFIDSLLEDILG